MNDTILQRLSCFFYWLDNVLATDNGSGNSSGNDPVEVVNPPVLSEIQEGEQLFISDIGSYRFVSDSTIVPIQNISITRWIYNGVPQITKPINPSTGDTVQVVLRILDRVGDTTDFVSNVVTVTQAVVVNYGVTLLSPPTLNDIVEGDPVSVSSFGTYTYLSTGEAVPTGNIFVSAWIVNGQRQLIAPSANSMVEGDEIQVVVGIQDLQGQIQEFASPPVTVSEAVVVDNTINCTVPAVLDMMMEGQNVNISSIGTYTYNSDGSTVPSSNVSVCGWVINNIRQNSTPTVTELEGGDEVYAIVCVTGTDNVITECVSNTITVGFQAQAQYGINCVVNATVDPISEGDTVVVSDLGTYTYVFNGNTVNNSSEVSVIAWIIDNIRQPSLPPIINAGSTVQAVIGIVDLNSQVEECFSNVVTVTQSNTGNNVNQIVAPVFAPVAKNTISQTFTPGTYDPISSTVNYIYTLNNTSTVSDSYVAKQGDIIDVAITASETGYTSFTGNVQQTVPLVTMAEQITEIEQAFNIVDPFYGDMSAFSGWISSDVDSTFTVNSPDALRAVVETWRPNSDQVIQIVLDWDGIQDFTNQSLRGPSAAQLTANAANIVNNGYDVPDGGVWITAASGREPVIGNTFSINGMPRIVFENVGFAPVANAAGSPTTGDNVRAIRFQSNNSFPCIGAAVFKSCDFGLTKHRPLEPETEFTKGIASTGALWKLMVEDCDFDGIRDQINGSAKYLIVRRNRSNLFISDFITQFGFTQSRWAGQRAYAIVEGNTVANAVNNPIFNGLHTDFYQAGTSNDQHLGNSFIVRHNVFNAGTTANDSGSQFVYTDDHLTAENNGVVYENIGCPSAFNAVAMHDTTGFGNYFVKNNTFMRATIPNGTSFAPVYSRIHVNNGLANSNLGGCGGRVEIENNYVTLISGDQTVLTSNLGNFYVDPRPNVPTGNDGSSESVGVRPEEVFVNGTFARNASDELVYTIPNEDASTVAGVRAAFSAYFRPIAGWQTQAGSSDPTTWIV